MVVFPKLLIATLGLTIIMGCNENSNNNATKKVKTDSIKPRVLSSEKYLDYTKICADCNGNIRCDADEQSVLSDEAGYFEFPDSLKESLANCPHITDVALPSSDNDSEAVIVKMISPAGCAYITPLTSMKHHDMSLQLTSAEANEKFKQDLITDMNACTDFLDLKASDSEQRKLEGEHLQKMAKHFMSSMQKIQSELNSLSDLEITETHKHHLAVDTYLKDINKHIQSVIKSHNSLISENSPTTSISATSIGFFPSPFDAAQQLAFLLSRQAAIPLDVKKLFSGSNEQQNIYTYADSDKHLFWVSNESTNADEIVQMVNNKGRNNLSSTPRILSAKLISKKDGNFVFSHFNQFYQKGEIDPNKSPANQSKFTKLDNENAIRLINALAPDYQYILSGKAMTVSHHPISMPFEHAKIKSWENATKAEGQINANNRFLNSEEMEIYELNKTFYKSSITYIPTPSCNSQPDDRYKDICRYLYVYDLTKPNTPFDIYHGLNFFDAIGEIKISKNIAIEADKNPSNAALISFPYNSSNVHAAFYLDSVLPVIEDSNIPFAYWFISSRLDGVGIRRSAGFSPNYTFLTDNNRTLTVYSSVWVKRSINGIDVFSVNVPADIQRRTSSPSKVHIAKIGDYFRYIDLNEIGSVVKDKQVGASLKTHNRILTGINTSNIKE
ncbi:hypothetical protein D5018_19165 [Parashewanella curva]|uniref:Uncharacterized protein n=1 Tax=Parashewanella curva TaxID=2338552 RepID=A0A3L8PRR4_9GAMM|nr:hypothetical protein [Parashewanella curva]RLV58075.1 hypothetical protein D5018_19165 [Parashewanella curva]